MKIHAALIPDTQPRVVDDEGLGEKCDANVIVNVDIRRVEARFNLRSVDARVASART